MNEEQQHLIKKEKPISYYIFFYFIIFILFLSLLFFLLSIKQNVSMLENKEVKEVIYNEFTNLKNETIKISTNCTSFNDRNCIILLNINE